MINTEMKDTDRTEHTARSIITLGRVVRDDGYVTIRLPDDFFEQMRTDAEEPIAFRAIDGGWIVRSAAREHAANA